MGFNPGAGGGIASASDVAFNSLVNTQVLTYNSSSAKWQNASGGSASASGVSFSPSGDPGDISATTVQAALQELDATKLSVAHGHVASDITSGQLAIDRLPAGSMVCVDKKKATFGSAADAWPTSRPTSRNDIVIVWKGNTDPGTIALAGDEWKVTET